MIDISMIISNPAPYFESESEAMSFPFRNVVDLFHGAGTELKVTEG